jgi:hypothetical protein
MQAIDATATVASMQGAAQRVSLVVRATAAAGETTSTKAATTVLCKIGTRGRCVLMPACPSPTTPRTGDAVRATLLQLTLHRLCRSGGEASLLDAIRTGLRFKTSMGATFLRELKELVRNYSYVKPNPCFYTRVLHRFWL